jgi:N6-adenosine-specific RNA methylase IME4
MTVPEICALPVHEFADDGHLYLWTVNLHIRSAYVVAEAWGYTPVCLLTWCKTPMGVGPGGLFSITTEFFLFARRGPEPRRMVVPSTWFAWPRRGQSVKPEAFYDLVEQVSPSPRLEMFARRQRLGWDTWGNEALNHVDLGGAA